MEGGLPRTLATSLVMPAGTTPEVIGKNIRRLREQRQLTTEALALQAGYGWHTAIADIERGRRRPSVEGLFAIARALAVPVDVLLLDPDTRTLSAMQWELVQLIPLLPQAVCQALLVLVKRLVVPGPPEQVSLVIERHPRRRRRQQSPPGPEAEPARTQR